MTVNRKSGYTEEVQSISVVAASSAVLIFSVPPHGFIFRLRKLPLNGGTVLCQEFFFRKLIPSLFFCVKNFFFSEN